MAETDTEQGAALELARLAEQLKELKAKADARSEYREALSTLESDITDLGKKIGGLQAVRNTRKAEYSQEDLDKMVQIEGNGPKWNPARQHKMDACTPEVREFQEIADNMYILGTLLKVDPRQTEYCREVAMRNPIMRKSLDTSAGAAWIPTDLSASMHEKVRLQLRVAALHSRINMPTNPYKLPIEGADATAYLVSERGDIDDDLTANLRVPAAGALQSSPAFTALTLTAKKLGCRVTTSAELTEESIIPILPELSRKLALAMATAQEDALVNGDTTSPHMDDDVTASTDRRKAWMGYRRLAKDVGTAYIANTTPFNVLDVADLRKLRMKMGIYGLNPRNLTIVTGGVGFNKLLSLKDGTNPSPIMTLEKYGPQATIITGEVARVDGIPIVLSESVRENLNHGDGTWDGLTSDATCLILVNNEQFLFGDYRATTLKSREIIETDQSTLVVLQRLCFSSWASTATNVGVLYDIRA